MGIKYNGKVYNNLQGQVAQNTEDIEKIKNAGVVGYEAGDGIDITDGVISVDTDVVQEKLDAGTGLQIVDDEISVKFDEVQAKLVAGQNITINNGIISATAGEPANYIKSASVNDAQDTLTLTKKDNSTVVFNPSIAAGTVTSVNEKTGAVVLDAEDVGVSGTNDGTNWTTLTIGDDTYAVGGGSSGNAVTDVKVNNVSCVTNNVANIPLANGANYGVTKGTIPTNAQLAIVGITNNGTAYYAEAEGTLDANVSDQWKAIKVVNSGAMVTKNVPRVSTTAAPSGAEVLNSVYVGDTQYALPTGGGSSTVIHAGNGIEVTAASDGYNVAAKANSSNNGIVVTSDGIGANFNAVQAKLTAGANISISGATISATDTVSSIEALNASISVTGTAPSQSVAVNFKPYGGLSYDSQGCYITDAPSCNGLTFEVVQSQPTSPVANRIYFILS